MKIEINIDASHAMAKLDGIGPNVHDALVKALAPLAQEVAAAARDFAVAHIRFEGKKPGAYLASIYGGVADKPGLVAGFVRSGHPLAHLLEEGANIPPHEIYPSAADVLAFEGSAGDMFAAHVNSPGAVVPAYPAIAPAFDAARGEIESTLEGTIRKAARDTGN